MSQDEASIIVEARAFLAELFDTGTPIQNLLRTGTFPDGWAERYLAFVQRVSAYYGLELPLPRGVLAVIYNASVYCTNRYFDWQRHSGSVNNATEALVDQVRWAGDGLLLSRFWRARSGAVG